MSNYVERIKLLTELFDEGHISEQEFGELVGSIRGGAVNEAYDQVGINSKDTVSIGGHDLVIEGDEQWEKEVNNPNKLDEYEAFFNNNTSEFKISEYYEWKDLYDPKFTDVSGNEIRFTSTGSQVYGCGVSVDTAGRVRCNHPFMSFEHNEPIPVKEHPAYPKILQAIKEGKIVLS